MISDDDLLLYYYRDGLEPAERARIGAALSEQPELARRLQALVARLDAVAAQPDVPVPAEVMQRWQGALAGAARGDDARIARVPRPRFSNNLRWMAVAATVAVVALVVGMQVAKKPQELTAEVTPLPAAAEAANASGYERSLKWHLTSTEQTLASLESADPKERARLVDEILAQNRIYALAAERAGEPQLARVLRAFSPILEGVAKGTGETSASSIAQLSFELRVMQGRLGSGTGAPANTPSTTL